MQYLFAGEWQETPAFAPYEGCLRLSVSYTVPLGIVHARDQRVIEPSLRKLIAFLLAEGLTTTIRKVRSKRAATRLASDYHVVFAVGHPLEIGNEQWSSSLDQTYLCIGTRHPACAEVMLFARELSVPLDLAPPKNHLSAAVAEAIAGQSLDIDAVGGYNLYSNLPVPKETRELLHRVAASLQTDDGEAHQGSVLPEPLEPLKRDEAASSVRSKNVKPMRQRGYGASVVAGGDYVRTDVIPALKRAGFALRVVADLEPQIAAYTQARFGFYSAATDWRHAIEDPLSTTIVIASFHDSHALIAAEALDHGKKVLLEKPPVVTKADLDLLLTAARSGSFLEVGYNRRYAPFSRTTRDLLAESDSPATITMLVKEVEIPPAHWYRWPNQGTRVTGNLCHWIDLAIFLIGARGTPREMTLSAPADVEPDEERALTVVFDDGSTATIIATQRGDFTLGVQELIDVRQADLSIRIHDFRRFHATRSGRTIRRSRSRRNKGHRAMYDEMLLRAKTNQPALYSLEDLALTSNLTILATEMVRSGKRHLTLVEPARAATLT